MPGCPFQMRPSVASALAAAGVAARSRAAPAGLRPRRPDSEGPARWRAENSAGALRVCVLRASYTDSPNTVEESSIRIPVPAGPKSRLAAETFRTQPSGRRSQPRASFRRWWRAEHEARHLDQKTQARAWASPGASHSTAHAHNAAIMHTAEQHMMRKPTAACAQHSIRALPRLAGGPLHDWHTARGTAHECPDDLRDACSGVHGCLVLYPARTRTMASSASHGRGTWPYDFKRDSAGASIRVRSLHAHQLLSRRRARRPADTCARAHSLMRTFAFINEPLKMRVPGESSAAPAATINGSRCSCHTTLLTLDYAEYQECHGYPECKE